MKRIKVAILGQGRSGRDIHAKYLSQDSRRFQVVAVVDPLKERRERAEKELNCETYRNYKSLLKRKDLDLVVNATPSKYHVPLSLEFLNAGFNVLCEKPLAQHTKDVDDLIDASEKNGVILAVFQQSRYAPYFQKIRGIINSGVLGEIIQISIAFNNFSRRYDWQTLTSEMGGNLLNTGPHPLDQALQLFGTDIMPNVNCIMRSTLNYGDAEDYVKLILSGENRPTIDLEISSCCAYPCFTYNIYCTQGGLKAYMDSMEWRYFKPQEAPRLKLIRRPLTKPDGTPSYCTADKLKWYRRTWKVPKRKQAFFNTMSQEYYRMLYNTLVKGTPLEITPQQVRQQVAVIEECQRQNPHIYNK